MGLFVGWFGGWNEGEWECENDGWMSRRKNSKWKVLRKWRELEESGNGCNSGSQNKKKGDEPKITKWIKRWGWVIWIEIREVKERWEWVRRPVKSPEISLLPFRAIANSFPSSNTKHAYLFFSSSSFPLVCPLFFITPRIPYAQGPSILFWGTLRSGSHLNLLIQVNNHFCLFCRI